MCFVHRQEGHPCIYLFYLALPRLGMNPLALSPHPTPLTPLPRPHLRRALTVPQFALVCDEWYLWLKSLRN